MIGNEEHCLQAGILTNLRVTEPLRRGDLLNAINKLAGERVVSKLRRKHRTQIARGRVIATDEAVTVPFAPNVTGIVDVHSHRRVLRIEVSLSIFFPHALLMTIHGKIAVHSIHVSFR